MFLFYFSFFDTYGDNLSQLTPYSLNSSLKGELSRKMVQNNEMVNDFILQLFLATIFRRLLHDI